MIASAGELGGTGKGTLIDAHVSVVVQVCLDNVIQLDAARWTSQIRESAESDCVETSNAQAKTPRTSLRWSF